nr:DMT family transporter [bacterium]
MANKKVQGYALGILTAGCWSFLPIVTRGLYAYGMTAGAVTAWRACLACVASWLLCLVADRSAFRITLRQLLFYAVYGFVGVTSMYLCYLSALAYIPVSMATALLNTAPAFVVLMAAVLFRERLTAQKLLAVACVMLGCALVVQAFSPGMLKVNGKGVFLGLISGISYAGLSVLGRFAVDGNQSPLKSMTWMLTFGALWMFLFQSPAAMVREVTQPAQWGLLAAMAIGCTVLPNLMYLYVVRWLGAGIASIIVTRDPIRGVTWAALLLGEGMQAGQIAGMALVMAGVCLPIITLKRAQKNAPPGIG